MSCSERTLNHDARMKPQACASDVNASFVVVSRILDMVIFDNTLDTLLRSEDLFKEKLGNFFEQQYPSPILTLLQDGSTLNVAAAPSVVHTLCGDVGEAELEGQGAKPVLWKLGFDLFRALVSDRALLKWTITVDEDGALKAARVVLPCI
eukprot:Nitzschia sp. Nitz4//scaffold3_size479765//1713//2162//NITZ4_000001-RA/size479765-processed-gene-0.35-mRNA-1//1//CDS//3329550461//1461//frame0